MGPVDLVEPPQKIFGSAIDVVAAQIIGEVIAQRRPREFLAEQIDLVQEEDDTGPHKPPGINDRIEQHQTLHHSVLQKHISIRVSSRDTDWSLLGCFLRGVPDHTHSMPHRK